jgi:hypothetical protein
MAKKRTAKKTDTRPEYQRMIDWSKEVLARILEWAEADKKASGWVGPLDDMALRIIHRRVNKLGDWVRMHLLMYPQPAISVDDGALLVILPLSQATKLARKIFGNVMTPDGKHRIGALMDLQQDEIKDAGWNMDWFAPSKKLIGSY